MRTFKLKIYFRDGPTPFIIENVTNMTTEGNLLRITTDTTGNVWYPLCNVFAVSELSRAETD